MIWGDAGWDVNKTDLYATRLNVMADSSRWQDVIQRDVDRLKKWAHGDFMRFNKTKSKVLLLGWGNIQHQSRLGDRLRAALPGRTWRCWQMRYWTCPGSVCSQPRKTIVSWAASKPAWPAGWEMGICPSAALWWDPTCSAESSPGVPSAGRTRTSWSKSYGGWQIDRRDGAPFL